MSSSTKTPPLLLAFDVLTTFGAAGEAVWSVGKHIEDPDERLAYLTEGANWLRAKLAEGIWRVLPVDFRTFVEADTMMNKRGTLWPIVLREGNRMNNGTYVEAVLTGGIGVAKALALDTLVPTPKGWKTMGDIQVGDQVLDERGMPCNVVMAHPVRYDRTCYEVEFSDGSVVVADGEHNWYTQTRNERRKRKSGAVRTTDELRCTLQHPTKQGGCANHSVPLTSPVKGEELRTVVDPYVFGAWLGDGSKEGNKFWSEDPFIVEQIAKHYPVKHLGGINYTIYGLRDALHYWGVHSGKRLPVDWLYASEEQRLALLQGLMDTDGTVNPVNGRCSITQSAKHLADEIYALIASLGFQPHMEYQRAKCQNGGEGDAYRIGFMAYADRPVFRLPRKKQLLKHVPTVQRERVRNRYIVDIRPVASVPVRCITVDSPSALYLVGRSYVPTHNTTLALYTQAYQLYVLACMENPHKVFDLDGSSEIVIVFQSLNAKLAQDVDYSRFRDMIEGSPFFREYFNFDVELKAQMKFPRNIVVKPVSGQDTAAIGQNVIGGIIDEVNFMSVVENSKQTKDGGTYDQAVANYNAIARRRESRFMQQGTLPGMLCLVSSRNYPGQLTDKREAEARTNPHIFVYDKRLWEIRPERFSGATFNVFTGDETRKPRIMKEGETVPEADQRLVMPIPIEYLRQFENDLLPALRDIAGVATLALHPFILNTDAVGECFGKVKSIASREECDFRDSKLQLIRSNVQNPYEPRFAHVDLALSKDSAGVCIGHVAGFKEMNRGDHKEMLPIIQFDMILEIKPPRGGEIEFENVRRLLYAVRDSLKVPVKWVTLDQYQSRDTMQILQSQGFITGYCSMDVDTRAYDATKQAFYDGRILAPKHAKAQKELITLEFDAKKNKIDHPPQGSKDVSDAVAGVILGLTMRREIWVRHKVPMQRIPKNLVAPPPKVEPRHNETDFERRRREERERGGARTRSYGPEVLNG